MNPSKCPVCGTHGKLWHTPPQVFRCGQCSSLFSEYGVVMDPQREMQDYWS